MRFEKIRYSKCPVCKQHGIPAFLKTTLSRGHNPVLKCKRCNRKFSVNFGISWFLTIAIATVWGIIMKLLSISFNGVSCAIIVVALMLFDYFAPLEEEDDE